MDAPRAVYQVVLPQDPEGGYIVVYEFPRFRRGRRRRATSTRAMSAAAAREGRSSRSTRCTTIRELGTTLIVYSYSPSTSPDPGSAQIADALKTLGIGFAPPR